MLLAFVSQGTRANRNNNNVRLKVTMAKAYTT